ncbi:hypothetical protein BRL93_21500 [Xanthomonas oryzae pv. oryzae]|nr:hypothetical protein BRL93_21500 [Xanthomonas oryzae pv. oryzae]
MTWATPFGSEVAQVRSPGPRHNRWCCDPELKPPLQSLSPSNFSILSRHLAQNRHERRCRCHQGTAMNS